MAIQFESIATDAANTVLNNIANISVNDVTDFLNEFGPISSTLDVSDSSDFLIDQFNSAKTAVTDVAENISEQINSLSNFSKTSFNDILNDASGISDSISDFANDFLKDSSSAFSSISSLFKNIETTADKILPEFIDFSSFPGSKLVVEEVSFAEVVGPIGGKRSQYYQDIQAEESSLDKIPKEQSTNVINAGEVSSGNSASRIPNPLRDHNHYNYIITLGILSAGEYNNPISYRKNPNTMDPYIIQSGGGDYGSRFKLPIEGGDDAEYFIEDLEFDAAIAPNKKTGVAIGTSMQFTVIEPYSMGNFIQALISAADSKGFKNYADAPFCIRIDFYGWNEPGDVPTKLASPSYMPIKIVKVDLNVTGKGSQYQVEAVPYSEDAMSDSNNQTKTTINVTGQFVHEILVSGVQSYTTALNDRTEYNEETKKQIASDRYLICFPKEPDHLTKVINNEITPKTYTVNAVEETQQQLGKKSPPDLDNPGPKEATTQALKIQPKGDIFTKLLNYATDPSFINEIGKSIIVENTAEAREQPMGDNNTVKNEKTDTNRIGGTELTFSEKSKTFQSHSKETITSFIEKVLLQSQYCRDHATAQPVNGAFKWWRIESYTFVDHDPASEVQIGRPPKVYVYAVMPYHPDSAKFLSGGERPDNTEGLKKTAAKEYNYIYTGKNEDIIDFDINFNNAFTQLAFANFAENSGSDASGLSNASHKAARDEIERGGQATQQTSQPEKSEIQGQTIEAVELPGVNVSGTKSYDIRNKIAEIFHHRITNQIVDMVSVEMTIWGDPFFIPQQTGNYVGKTENGTLSVSSDYGDDYRMAYTEYEVFVIVNFLTPFDYQMTGPTMEVAEKVARFSGLFSVWGVTNKFSKGKFTQVLKMIRRRGQDDPATNNKGTIIKNITKVETD